jgi:hypothetical protein
VVLNKPSPPKDGACDASCAPNYLSGGTRQPVFSHFDVAADKRISEKNPAFLPDITDRSHDV